MPKSKLQCFPIRLESEDSSNSLHICYSMYKVISLIEQAKYESKKIRWGITKLE